MDNRNEVLSLSKLWYSKHLLFVVMEVITTHLGSDKPDVCSDEPKLGGMKTGLSVACGKDTIGH